MTQEPAPRLHFHARHLPAVRDGSKRITMRHGEDPRVGPVLLAFGPDDEVVLPGRVVSTAVRAVRDVTDEEAREDGFGDASDVLPGLRAYYPALTADDLLVLVRFDVDASETGRGGATGRSGATGSGRADGERPLTARERDVLHTAVEAARLLAERHGGDDVHTVVATALDAGGRLHTAANVFHFTGGPCAELAVLGAAAAVTAEPLTTVVAVAGGGRGVLPPCGRCRQVLLDLQPGVRVIVVGDAGPVTVAVTELLPHAYRQPPD